MSQCPDSFPLLKLRIKTETVVSIYGCPIEPSQVPTTPHAISLEFSMSTAIANFSPVVSGDQVTSRAVTFLINTVPQTPVSAAPGETTASIACLPGDVVSYTLIDTNVVGPSLPSNSISGTDPFPVPTAVPTTPTAISISFVDP